MEFIQNIIVFLLLFSLVFGLCCIFFYDNYLKKISCLSVAYTSLILIVIIFIKDSDKSNQIFAIIVTALILFSITLAIGIGIISNIARLKSQLK
jgi:cytochrome bd-type quinol oxidase subunit 2